METYSLSTFDLADVLDTFIIEMFPACPYKAVPLAEIAELFKADHPAEDDDRHYVTDSQMFAFFDKINALSIERTLGKLVEDGRVEMLHDGTEFLFRAVENNDG